MLVLTRKPEESIVFIDRRTGERIEVLVARVSSSSRQVRLGITAGNNWDIARSELLDEATSATPVVG